MFSLRRATYERGEGNYKGYISIHALLAESDPRNIFRMRRTYDFNPRSPCGERRDDIRTDYATDHISIHALLTESDRQTRYTGPLIRYISIHALLTESDARGFRAIHAESQFQSTLSSRRATLDRFFLGEKFLISIHALLAESDFSFIFPLARRGDFNPRSPCGERRLRKYEINKPRTFQSTLSLRRATLPCPGQR